MRNIFLLDLATTKTINLELLYIKCHPSPDGFFMSWIFSRRKELFKYKKSLAIARLTFFIYMCYYKLLIYTSTFV